MGGRIALRAALASPLTYAGLVVVSTSAGIESAQQRLLRTESDERFAVLLEANRWDAFEAAWQAQPIWQGDPPAVSRQAKNMRSSSSAQGLARALRAFSAGRVEPVWNDLTKIDFPTTILAGARDAKYVSEATRLNQLTAASVVEVIPNRGHSLPLEDPAAVADAIRRLSLRLPQEEQ